jgi:hypothetical protein
MAVMMNEKGTEMSKSVSVSLTPTQIDYLRGLIYEYYNTQGAEYMEPQEELLHSQLEEILADAENQAFLEMLPK